MIKALLLILDPIRTWERIVVARRRWQLNLLLYFIPFLAVVTVAEGYGIKRWGKPRGEFARIQPVSPTQIVTYETAQVLLSLFIIFLMARLIKSLGETFHGRHTFGQTFTVAVYGVSPILLLRLLDAFPSVSPWLTWGVGVILFPTNDPYTEAGQDNGGDDERGHVLEAAHERALRVIT